MSKFLTYLFLRLLALSIILYLLDALYTSIYKHKKGIRSKIDFIYQNKEKEYDYIFLGSSRVEFHVNTNLIDKETGKKSLNLGISGQNLPETFLMLKLLSEKKITAKKYFVQIDEADLVKNKKKHFAGESYFLPFIKNKQIDAHLKKYDLDYFKDTKIPFYRYMNYGYNIGYREILLKLVNKNRTKGFFIGGETKLQNTTNSNNFKNTYSTELIDEILRFGEKKNIEIVLYTSPYYNIVNGSFFKEKLRKKNIANYIDSIPHIKMFKDIGHLNKFGAEKFTKLLIRDFDLKN